MYLLGYDIGSSSVKAAIVEAATGKVVAKTQYPESEMEIQAPQAGWAEQDPEIWWKNVCMVSQKVLAQSQIDSADIKAIGISYQMHGLVLVDQENKVLRPSIIWCDGRAVEIGNQAFAELGEAYCLEHYLNSPGNFTASKLRWVIEHEPDLYEKADAFMLPGDYIALRLSGERCTTVSGLSEGVLWDFKAKTPAQQLMQHYGIHEHLVPEIKPTFSNQGQLSAQAAKETGLRAGTVISYRAGDQPNNALCLNVLHPGQVAATGGTSGVVYGVVDQALYDQASRVNGFAHVNYTDETPNVGILLCVNGAGIQHNWMRQNAGNKAYDYPTMERMAAQIPIGADGISVLPFGNNAERILENKDIGSSIHNLQFSRHGQAHLFRAGLEGIAFAFVYGLEIMTNMGMDFQKMRVGNDNLFQSKVFAETITSLTKSTIEVVDTTGAIGAAKAAGLEVGAFDQLEAALGQAPVLFNYEPQQNPAYQEAYFGWKTILERNLG